MRPDRWDIVLEKLHEQTGLDKTFLKDFMKFYWKKAREHIVNTKHYCLELNGIGSMTMINARAVKLKQRYEEVLENYPVNTIGMFKRRQRIEETVNNLKHAIETFEEDRKKFIKVMEKRYGKYTPNLEKQKKYSGRY